MLDSVEKDQLYTALAQAQVEFPTIRVNRKAFKNEYADLYAILKPVYPILTKYGLSIRPWGGILDGVQCVGARLMHKSGQFETNVFVFESDPCKNPNDQPSHKKQGALTYFNRNHIKDMLGVLISDDDQDDDMQGHIPVAPISGKYITQEQLDHIHFILKDNKKVAEDVLRGLSSKGISELQFIPKEMYSACVNRIGELKREYESINR